MIFLSQKFFCQISTRDLCRWGYFEQANRLAPSVRPYDPVSGQKYQNKCHQMSSNVIKCHQMSYFSCVHAFFEFFFSKIHVEWKNRNGRAFRLILGYSVRICSRFRSAPIFGIFGIFWALFGQISRQTARRIANPTPDLSRAGSN